MFTLRTEVGTMLLRMLWRYVLILALVTLAVYQAASTCDIQWDGVCIRIADTPTHTTTTSEED